MLVSLNVLLTAVFSDGCPGLCFGNGRCTLDQNGWHCVCQVGWSGTGCNVVMEMLCGDNLDNDGGESLIKCSHKKGISQPLAQ